MRVLVYGSGSFAATVSDLARHCGHEVVGMIDDFRCGAGIVGTLEEAAAGFDRREHGVLLAIGYKDLAARWAAWQRLQALGFVTPTLVHPRAYVADTAALGPGCLVMAHATVDRCASLGQVCVVWPGVCINHDTSIGDNNFFSPSAVICGDVVIGSHCFIGAAAALANGTRVPDGSFIKMASRYTATAS